MRTFTAAVIACWLGLAGAVPADDSFGTIAEAQASFVHFLDEYVHRDAAEALRRLPRFSSSRTEEEQRAQIQKVVQWHAQSSEKRGAALGYQFVSTKTIADVVTRLRYIVLTERQPLTVDAYFYRTSPSQRWQLADVQFISGPVKLFANEEQ